MASQMDPRLLRLLHWSLAQQGNQEGGESSTSDASESKEAKEKTIEQRRLDVEWLTKALSEIAPTVDPVDQMKLLVAIVEDAAAPPEKKEEALTNLLDFVENIDLARDYQTIGGLKATIECIGDPNVGSGVWGIASEIVGVVVQNLPVAQQGAFTMGVLPKLVTVAKDATLSGAVRSKALMGVSCLVRGHDEAAAAFMASHDGVGLLVRIALDGEENIRIRRKCMFLLRYFAEEMKTRREPFDNPSNLLSSAAVPLARVLKSTKDAALREHGLHLALLLQKLDPARSAADWTPMRQLFNGGAYAKEHSVNDEDPEGELAAQLQRALDPSFVPEPEPFIPTHTYQEVLEHHVLPAGLEVRVNMTTGKKEARLLAPSTKSKKEQEEEARKDAHARSGKTLYLANE